MSKEKLFQVGIKALIANSKGEILVLDSGDWHMKNQTRHWDIPGGRIQQGQSAMETLQREVEEETGINQVSNPEFFTTIFSNFKDMPVGDHMVGLILMIYKVEIPENSKIVLSEEHSGYEWVSRQEAAKRLSYKYPEEFTKKLAS